MAKSYGEYLRLIGAKLYIKIIKVIYEKQINGFKRNAIVFQRTKKNVLGYVAIKN